MKNKARKGIASYIMHSVIGAAMAVLTFSTALAMHSPEGKDAAEWAAVEEATIEDYEILKPYMDADVVEEMEESGMSFTEIIQTYMEEDAKFAEAADGYFK